MKVVESTFLPISSNDQCTTVTDISSFHKRGDRSGWKEEKHPPITPKTGRAAMISECTGNSRTLESCSCVDCAFATGNALKI